MFKELWGKEQSYFYLGGILRRLATTRAETRYGCFLPDLTGLARGTPITSLPPPISDMFHKLASV